MLSIIHCCTPGSDLKSKMYATLGTYVLVGFAHVSHCIFIVKRGAAPQPYGSSPYFLACPRINNIILSFSKTPPVCWELFYLSRLSFFYKTVFSRAFSRQSLSATCHRSVVSSGCSTFLHHETDISSSSSSSSSSSPSSSSLPPRYDPGC